MELVVGIEPTTGWLQISCSTIEPHQHLWCRGAESNHRHWDFQSHALPTELPRHTYFFNWNKRKTIWRPETGSNRRPPAWQAGALTNWATGPYRLFSLKFWWAFTDLNRGPTGYEPVALTNWAKGPINLFATNGRGSETRTHDLTDPNRARYQTALYPANFGLHQTNDINIH